MKQQATHVLAVDLGASTGRVMLASLEEDTLTLREVRRFDNTPVSVNNRVYWDVLRLWHDIKQGIAEADRTVPISSIAVDTWGVDYGLLDANGQLLGNPVHYRDTRTAGRMEQAFALLDKTAFYHATGNQFMEINTAFQLLAERDGQPGALAQAKTLLPMPALFTWLLCGAVGADESIASTTQLFDVQRRAWAGEVVSALGLPAGVLPPVVKPGSVAGSLRPQLADELGIAPCPVIAACGHDTQCAQASVPTQEAEFLFLSSGTWSLMGTELAAPLVNADALARNLTNECAYGGKASFMKNITGLWLVQESRRQWRREGHDYSFAQLSQQAEAAQPFRSLIRPEADAFAQPGDLPARIAGYCRATGQPPPRTPGETVRCIAESLALTYRETAGELSACTGTSYPAIHIVGGGVQDTLLCAMTASACNCDVYAGPVEATALGNAAIQLIALGALPDIRAARALVARSQGVDIWKPENPRSWDDAYRRFAALPATV